jgi:hypothetical protein
VAVITIGHSAVRRLVNGDEVAATDELVELEHVHVPAMGRERSVQDQEEVIGIGVDLRNGRGLEAISDCQRMEVEGVLEDAASSLVGLRQVDPDEPGVARQQLRHYVHVVPLDAAGGEVADDGHPVASVTNCSW